MRCLFLKLKNLQPNQDILCNYLLLEKIKFISVDSGEDGEFISIVFPDKGVPLIWNFLLSKSKINNQILIDWIKFFEKRIIVDELANQGWYLPFNNEFSQSKYNIKNRFDQSKITKVKIDTFIYEVPEYLIKNIHLYSNWIA